MYKVEIYCGRLEMLNLDDKILSAGCRVEGDANLNKLARPNTVASAQKMSSKFNISSRPQYIETEDYKFSHHATQRGEERFVTYQDALYVLANGIHEENKTSFDFKRKTWKYAIRGKTTDGFDTRVVVAFVEGMVIITVIRLFKKSRRAL